MRKPMDAPPTFNLYFNIQHSAFSIALYTMIPLRTA